MTLDEAMQAAEAALPSGWIIGKLQHWQLGFRAECWVAEAYRTGPEYVEPGSYCRVERPTLIEALGALREQLADPRRAWLPRRAA